MNDVQRLKNLKVEQGTIVIIRPERDNWYDVLEVVASLAGIDVIVLDRFSSNISIISEKRMNKMGWYKSG